MISQKSRVVPDVLDSRRKEVEQRDPEAVSESPVTCFTSPILRRSRTMAITTLSFVRNFGP